MTLKSPTKRKPRPSPEAPTPPARGPALHTTLIRDPAVLAALAEARVEGPQIFLTSQLDRKTYEAVNKVLEALGGQWVRKSKAHVFDEEEYGDTRAKLEGVIETGAFVDLKKSYDAFFTPADFAKKLVGYVSFEHVGHGKTWLEPSCGEGAIVRAMLDATGGAPLVIAYDLNPKYGSIKSTIRGLPQSVAVEPVDFLAVPVPGFKVIDVVVMNPPFSRQQDIDHANHALDMLVDGGSFVCVMSAGVVFRQNKKAVDFRARIAALGGRFVENPDGTFAASGTNVRTVTCLVGCPE